MSAASASSGAGAGAGAGSSRGDRFAALSSSGSGSRGSGSAGGASSAARRDRHGGAGSASSLPEPVQDFLRQFCAAVKRGNVFDIARCYETEWAAVTERFYATARWPEVAQIEDLCKRDYVFMVLYRLLYYRHVMFYLAAKGVRATLEDHVNAWGTYTEFFNIALERDYSRDVVLPPQWLYELLSEFILHFQAFLQLRVNPSVLSEEERKQLVDTYASVWSLLDVMHPLYVLAARSDIATTLAGEAHDARDLPSGLLSQLGYFALVSLCRLHCLLGDYGQALRIIAPLNLNNEALFSRVAACHITLFYYVGFALIMSRRYVEAMRVYGRVLMYFHRTKNLHDRTSQGQIMTQLADQMLGLLAICVALCPGQMPHDSVFLLLRNTHGDLAAAGDKIKAMASGSDDGLHLFAEMFKAACPNFLPATMESSTDMLASARDTFENQAALFLTEVKQRVRLVSATRSYLRLYTNITTAKLSEFQTKPPEDVHTDLIGLKLKMYQNQGGVGAGSTAAWTASDPLHFHLDGDTVVIDEVTVEAQTSEHFLENIKKFSKVMTDVHRLKGRLPQKKGRGGRGGGRGGRGGRRG